MKKAIALALSLVLSLGILAGCGGGGKNNAPAGCLDESLSTRISSSNWGDICMIPTTVQLPDLSLYFQPLCNLSAIENEYNFAFISCPLSCVFSICKVPD